MAFKMKYNKSNFPFKKSEETKPSVSLGGDASLIQGAGMAAGKLDKTRYDAIKNATDAISGVPEMIYKAKNPEETEENVEEEVDNDNNKVDTNPENKENTPSNTYEVKKGDNLSKIAKANNMTLDQLLELNPDYKNNPNMVRTGATLNL